MHRSSEMEGREADEVKSLVESFCNITSATRDEASFFLESHNWSLDSAVQSFYDDHLDPPQPQPISLAPDPEQDVKDDDEDVDEAVNEEGREEEEEVDSDDEDYVPSETENDDRSAAPRRFRKGTGSRVEKSSPSARTMADLKRKAPSSSDSDSYSDSDSDGSPGYYTGGEKSGMVVRNKPKGRNDIEAIFDQAVQTAPSSDSDIIHTICFWRNGFTVNDGPLRKFDDPENLLFLESLKKSECPKELKSADRSPDIHVNLIRRAEKFPVSNSRNKRAKHRCTAFQGVGRTISTRPSSTNDPTQPDSTTIVLSNTSTSSSSPVQVDDSLPTTSLQLRLADGTRMVARFNMQNSIGDVRAFINASRPEGRERNYRLQMVGFPPKQLDDVSMTIEEAGIANSVVIQRL